MKKTIKMLGCWMPRHSLFHCVLFVLAFSHFISSPTARTIMNDFVDHAFVSKIGVQLNTKDTMPGQASSGPVALQSERPASPLYPGIRCYAVQHLSVVSALINPGITERLLL